MHSPCVRHQATNTMSKVIKNSKAKTSSSIKKTKKKSRVRSGLAKRVNLRSQIFPVKREEYVNELNATTTFGYDYYDISFVSATQFPWLSTYAAQFQRWRLKGLSVHYKANTSKLYRGPIVICFVSDYDTSFTPATLPEGSALTGAKEGPISSNLEWRINSEVLKEGNQKLINSYGVLGGYGYLYIGYSSDEAGIIGSLKITFDIEFYDPVPKNQARDGYFLESAYFTAESQLPVLGNYDWTSWRDSAWQYSQFINCFSKKSDIYTLIQGQGKYFNLPPGDWNFDILVHHENSAGTHDAEPWVTGIGNWLVMTYAIIEDTVNRVTRFIYGVRAISHAAIELTCHFSQALSFGVKVMTRITHAVFPKGIPPDEKCNVNFNDAVISCGKHIPVRKLNNKIDTSCIMISKEAMKCVLMGNSPKALKTQTKSLNEEVKDDYVRINTNQVTC